MTSTHMRSVLRITALALMTVVGCLAAAAPGLAAEGHEGFHGGPHWEARPGGHSEGRPVERWEDRPAPHWGHGDIRGFRGHDFERWRAGHWVHGEHVGRPGWWWVVDGSWLFYPYPVYPYPDPYVPPGVVVQAPGNWYYCPTLGAYYPYVSECPVPWQPVTPTPAS